MLPGVGSHATRAFDPRDYPGPRAGGPVLVHRGEIHPLGVEGTAGQPLSVLGAAADRLAHLPVLRSPRAVHWSLAYGSNASPERLVAKSLDRRGALLLPARAHGVVAAFEHRRTSYGSVPLTLVPDGDAVIDLWVLGLPTEDVALLDRTEGRRASSRGTDPTALPADGHLAPPGTYRLGAVGTAIVADRFLLRPALAYVPGPDTRVQTTATGAWRCWPAVGQGEAAGHLAAGGPWREAPPVASTIAGPWPVTSLDDAPLLVHGSRRPDGPDFAAIAELVEVVGPAAVRGRAPDPGAGRRAPERPEQAREARGVLLAPRTSSAGRELFAVMDAQTASEGRRRRSVRVDGPRGTGWAVTYVRSDDGERSARSEGVHGPA